MIKHESWTQVSVELAQHNRQWIGEKQNGNDEVKSCIYTVHVKSFELEKRKE